MDVLITKPDGTQTKLSDHGVVARDFSVSSPEMRAEYGAVEGAHGVLPYGFTHGPRAITVPFYYKAQDNADYALLRDELFRLAARGEPFYIAEMRRIKHGRGDDVLIGGKRYLVRLAAEIAPEQTMDYGFGELQFETTRLPYAESVGTTLDLDRDGINADSALWGFGMGLIADDASTKYVHTGATFRVYNAGDVEVHPFESQLRIVVDQAVGSAQSFELANRTTGDVFRLTEGLAPNATLVLDGPNITLNSAAALRKTNRQYITLAPGWNEFAIAGATSARVSVDFRYLYL